MKIKVERNAEIIGHLCQSRMLQQGCCRKNERTKIMNYFNKLRAMLSDIENNPNIFGDIVGAFCIFGMLFIGLFFVGVLQ